MMASTTDSEDYPPIFYATIVRNSTQLVNKDLAYGNQNQWTLRIFQEIKSGLVAAAGCWWRCDHVPFAAGGRASLPRECG